VLRKKMLYFSAGSKVAEIREKIEEVQFSMFQNIGKVFLRQDNLLAVSEKAAGLLEQAPLFKRKTKKLKCKKMWMNKKVTAALGMCLCCCCCLIVYAILAGACGGIALDNCLSAILQGVTNNN